MLNETYKVGEVAKLLDVTGNTIRNYCKHHAAHLSQHANPPGNGTRVFTLRDLNVLRYVQVALQEGETHAEIARNIAHIDFDDDDESIVVARPTTHTSPLPTSPQTAQNERDEAFALQAIQSSMQAQIDAIRSDYSLLRGEVRAEFDAKRRDDMFFYVFVGTAFGLLLSGVIILAVFWANEWWFA